MGTLNALIELVLRTLNEWRSSGISGLVFNARNAALLASALLAVLAATALVWRSLRGRLPGRTAIALPAVLPRIRRSPLSFVRHTPFLLFLAGLPFFCLALADPQSSLSARQTSYPGRRIAVIMDASLSMLSPFSGQQLKTQSDTAFSNTMAAAEYFIRVRMKGKYRDLIALEQFGNEAYVITPFTTDYENLLLSLKMISDVNEWQRFPDQGTIIMKAWKKAIDATGGKFYPAASQETIMQAIKEIDAAATGRVDVREYEVKQPKYMKFALAAVVFWTLALALQMSLRMFRTFP
jgi:hypothetical protein